MSLRGLFVLMGLVVFGVPVAGSVLRENPTASTPAITAQDVYIVAPASAGDLVEADGEIEAEAIYDLSFLAGGRVNAIYVDEGDSVQAGDVLAVLENERQRVALAQAEVGLQIVTLQRDDLLEVDADEIAIAQARIDAAANNYAFLNNQVRPEDLQAASLQAGAAADSVNAAQLARIQAGGVPDEAIALLDAEIGEASFNAEIARLQAENLRDVNAPNLGAAAANIQQAEAQLARVLAGPSEYEVNDANLAVSAAENSLAQAQTAFERTLLIAPEDGIVTSLNIEVGQRIAPGVPVVQIIDIEPLHALLEVDEIDLRKLEIGMDARVVLDAMPGTAFDATITRIAQNGVERAGIVIYEAEAELAAPDERIRPGMTATTFALVEAADPRLVVPVSYVAEGDSGPTVRRVLDDGTIETVPVITGETLNNTVEITAGLQAGDALIPAPVTE